ncbi:uncharacterized protein G2W53_037126 [Senna tora]|uniref:Uncharacterized protein n=1 Tax=Senna tora TaxID=362788 RepID=A0A834STS9_9FABA|nr:uncharacterized protein G2W53_037126 [Senna tora]
MAMVATCKLLASAFHVTCKTVIVP